MSIEAMNQALDALVKSKNALEVLWVSHHANRTDYAIEDIESAIKALRAAIQQAEAQQPATGEPVVDVRCEGCGYMTHHREHMGCVRSAKQHTHPAPSVPDDVVRDAAQEAVEELHKLNEYAIVYINDPEWTRVSDTCQKLIGSIDAAMLAAK